MAVRRVYSVCAITFARGGQVSDVIVGFTVARSDEEVSRIVREHVGPKKRFSVYHASAGSASPKVGAMEARELLNFEHQWLDPRPAAERDGRPVPALVEYLMSRDVAC